MQGKVDLRKTRDRRRVAIIGTRGYPSYYGGFETAVRHLAPALADSGWEVVVYGRGRKEHAGAADPRVTTIHTPGIESKSLSTLTFGMTACLDAIFRGVDVALVMNVANGFWLPLLHFRGIRTVVNVDGIEWERKKWGTVARKVFMSGARMTARWADHLIVDAVAIGDRWRRDYKRQSTFIPYGGVTAAELPAPLGLPRGKYILFVARLVPENTVIEFIEALEYIAQKYEVVIVGSSGYGGEIENRLRNIARNASHVRWLGHVADDVLLWSLWQNAGVYFHGHSVGGTNPALVQAMALGVPIIARDTIYNREVLGQDYPGFVESDGRKIAAAIDGLMSDSSARVKLGSRLLNRAVNNYSWADVNLSYVRVLTDLVNGR